MATTEPELARMQARIEELEDELHRSRPSRPDRPDRPDRRYRWESEAEQTYDDVWDLGERKGDELSRFFRGLVRAAFETKRIFTDSAGDFADEVLERNVPERGDSPRDVTRRLPSDIARSFVDAWDSALEAPRRAVDRFDRTYRDEHYADPRDRRRARRARERSRSYDVYPSTPETVSERELESWPKAQLTERAEELGVDVRSSMTKSELVEAIASHQADLEDLSRAELSKRARELDIEGRSTMTRDQLIEAIRTHSSN